MCCASGVANSGRVWMKVPGNCGIVMNLDYSAPEEGVGLRPN